MSCMYIWYLSLWIPQQTVQGFLPSCVVDLAICLAIVRSSSLPLSLRCGFDTFCPGIFPEDLEKKSEVMFLRERKQKTMTWWVFLPIYQPFEHCYLFWYWSWIIIWACYLSNLPKWWYWRRFRVKVISLLVSGISSVVRIQLYIV